MRLVCVRSALTVNSLVAIAVAFALIPGPWAQASEVSTGAVLKHLDFTGKTGVPPREWLEDKDFVLKHHFRDDKRIELVQADDAMHFKTKKKSFGIIVHEEDIAGARKLRLEWGVSEYPKGASYQHGVDDEAVMVYVFFGHETFDSGSMLIPDSPYFIGFYLCANGTDALETPFKGNHFKKSGRYICTDHPAPGESVVSLIDLGAEFKKSFGLNSVPSVSGISIEVDTTHADNDGHAAAFISSLKFLP